MAREPRGLELHQFLGLSREDYALWIAHPEVVDAIVKERGGSNDLEAEILTPAADHASVEVERHPVESTAIRSIGYDPERQVLDVEYQNGRIYRYFSVPQPVYDELVGGGSIGEFINYVIKPKYSYAAIKDALG